MSRLQDTHWDASRESASNGGLEGIDVHRILRVPQRRLRLLLRLRLRLLPRLRLRLLPRTLLRLPPRLRLCLQPRKFFRPLPLLCLLPCLLLRCFLPCLLLRCFLPCLLLRCFLYPQPIYVRRDLRDGVVGAGGTPASSARHPRLLLTPQRLRRLLRLCLIGEIALHGIAHAEPIVGRTFDGAKKAEGPARSSGCASQECNEVFLFLSTCTW